MKESGKIDPRARRFERLLPSPSRPTSRLAPTKTGPLWEKQPASDRFALPAARLELSAPSFWSEDFSVGLKPTQPWGHVFVHTNEPGLTAALARSPLRGGAMVGVSGALMESAATLQAALMISVDEQPRVADAVRVVDALLRLLDQRAVRGDWAEDQVAAEFSRWMGGGKTEAGRQEVLGHLRAAGLPADFLERVSEDHVDAEKKGVLHHFDTHPWCADPKKVGHLRRLAVGDRMVAVTADLRDPLLVGRLNDLAGRYGEEISLIHLSNVLDYVNPGEEGPMRAAFQGLALRGDAQLLSSTDMNDLPDRESYLGSFLAPRLHEARSFLRQNLPRT